MDKKRVLHVYMDRFFTEAAKWAKEAGSYEQRHKKRAFASVIAEMNRFARRYMGEGNYMAYNDDLMYYLIKEGWMIRDEKNNYDVTPEKFDIYVGII